MGAIKDPERMEDKKKRLSLPPILVESFRYNLPQSGSEPNLMPTEEVAYRKRSFSSCLLFVLLGVFVFTLGCFAVYTAISMGTVQKSSADKMSAKPLTMNEEIFKQRPKSNFQFELTIDGQKVLSTNSNGEVRPVAPTPFRPVDEFSTLRNFLRKISGEDSFFRPIESGSSESSEIKNVKPKIKSVTIQSFVVRKLPKPSTTSREPSSSESLDDVLDSILKPSFPQVVPTKKAEEPKIFITPFYPKALNKSPATTQSTQVPKSEEKPIAFPQTIFKDFENILGDFFKDSKEEEIKKPKTVRTSTFIIPFNNFRKPTFVKPKEEVEIFKSLEPPVMDRYKSSQKKSGSSESDIEKFLFGSSPSANVQPKQKSIRTGPLADFFGPSDMYFLDGPEFHFPSFSKEQMNLNKPYPKKYSSSEMMKPVQKPSAPKDKPVPKIASQFGEVPATTTPPPTPAQNIPQQTDVPNVETKKILS